MDTILLVDDDPVLQRIYATALPLGGFRHLPAGNLDEACARCITSGRLDAAIVDLHLPGADGIEVLIRLRRLPAAAAAPAVLFTIAPDAAVRARAAAIAGVTVLDKSSTGPTRMLACLHQLLGRSPPPATRPATPIGEVGDLDRRICAVACHPHHAVDMLRAACLSLAGQLYLIDLREHPASLGGLRAAVDLLERALSLPPAALGPVQALAAVADDDRGARLLLHSALRKHGMAVAEFLDGEALLCGVRAARCDLVITDLLMPRRSGVSVVAALQDECPGLPVIVVTALPPDRQAFSVKHQPDEVLIKPFLLAEVATKAWYHVLHSRLRQHLPQSPAQPSDPWLLAH